MGERDPTKRFSTRVEHYRRFRPGYPGSLTSLLREHDSLRPGDVVADLGFGTGKLAELFLADGHVVYAVEPNDEMREAGRQLVGNERCHVVAGRAEQTGLPEAGIDLAVAGQAFHWFEPDATFTELRRILKPAGRLALIWNVRDERWSAFMTEYEALLADHGTDYRNVGAHGIDAPTRKRLFGPRGGLFHELPNEQRLDRDGLIGRVLSASYAPEPGAAGHAAMIEALDDLFRRHENSGAVVLRYRTAVYHGAFFG
jgi:SAM-dependent methyltransferase